MAVDGDTPVFSDAKGGYLNLSNFSRWWRSFTKENGFEGLCFHELRHTQATQLLAHGVDVKTDRTAADLMGAIYNAPAEPSASIVKVDRKTA